MTCSFCFGATDRTWTGDLLITNQLLYRLSHSSLLKSPDECAIHPDFSGGEGGIWTLDTLLGYTRFPIVRARPATRLLHFWQPLRTARLYYCILWHLSIPKRQKFQSFREKGRADPLGSALQESTAFRVCSLRLFSESEKCFSVQFIVFSQESCKFVCNLLCAANAVAFDI